MVANLSASLEPGLIFGIEGASHLSARRLYVPDQGVEMHLSNLRLINLSRSMRRVTIRIPCCGSR